MPLDGLIETLDGVAANAEAKTSPENKAKAAAVDFIWKTLFFRLDIEFLVLNRGQLKTAT